jgi:hypothetical protein
LPKADPHYLFLQACFGADVPIGPCLASDRWNWDALIARAAREQVLGALAGRIRELSERLPTPIVVPQDVQEALDAMAEMNRARNKWILSELRTIAGFLNERGIEPVVLKGAAALLSGVYEDLADRYLADLDLLIREGDFEAAIEAFRENGFRCEETNPIELAVGHAYPAMYRENSPEVDVHRYIGLGICRKVLPVSEVWERSVLVTAEAPWAEHCSFVQGSAFHSVRVRVPRAEHQVIHNILHAQVHDRYRERIWPSLRTFYELERIRQRFRPVLDWVSVRRRFLRHGIVAPMELHLGDAAKVAGFLFPYSRRISALTRLRRAHRKALRGAPRARYIDPIYVVQSAFLQRMRRVGDIAGRPGGWLYLTQKPFTSRFIARLASDFL